jgi:hypothetical protein
VTSPAPISYDYAPYESTSPDSVFTPELAGIYDADDDQDDDQNDDDEVSPQ